MPIEKAFQMFLRFFCLMSEKQNEKCFLCHQMKDGFIDLVMQERSVIISTVPHTFYKSYHHLFENQIHYF